MPKRDQVMIPTKGMTYEPRKKIHLVCNYNEIVRKEKNRKEKKRKKKCTKIGKRRLFLWLDIY